MKRPPYILLFILVIILTFIIGFRLGQKTEKTNKKIDYILSITPTPRPPTPTPVKYTQTKSKKWGIKITYPTGLKITESSTSAEIKLEPLK